MAIDYSTSEIFEEQMKSLLQKLDHLIDLIQQPNIPSDTDFNPDADFEPSTLDHTDLAPTTEAFLFALSKVEFPGNAIQYARITQRVFTDTQWFDAVENIVQKIKDSVEKNCLYLIQENEEIARRCYKLLDHLLLASYQLGEITNHTREQTQALNEELRKSKEELENLKGIQFNIQNELSKIYVQFVTILSILTAVVLSIFGGLQMISAAFTNIKDAKLWEVTFTTSLLALAVLCMLGILTGWISSMIQRLFDKTYKNSLKNYVLHNGAFVTGIFIFSYIAIVSAVFASSAFRRKINEIVELWGSWPIIVLLSIPLLIGAGVFIKTIDFRTFKKEQDES